MKIPFRGKAVDPKDEKLKPGTIVKKYMTQEGMKVDVIFDEDRNNISKGHYLSGVVKLKS